MDEARLKAARREFASWSALPAAERRARVAACPDAALRELMGRWIDDESSTLPGARAQPESDRGWYGRVLDHYRLDGVIGEGGMGRVYAATDLRDGRSVAIKRVRPDLATPTLTRRLAREFELMQRIDHPGIVRPLAMAFDDDGHPFLVLERVFGEAFALAEQGRPTRDRVAWIAAAARLAGVAHAQGIVHRDIKPSNLMIGDDGRVFLLDFGIAKPVADEAMTALTQTGERLMTPRYAAPEQFRGESVGARADVFALGTVLADSVFGIDATSQTGADLTRRDADSLRAIIGCARANDPARRYPDGTALADDLDRWLSGRSPRLAGWRARWMPWAMVAAAVALTVVVAVLIQGELQRRAQPLDAGFGLIVGDTVGMSDDAATSLTLAIAADADGDRPRAQALLRAAAAESPQHPLPMFYAALWQRASGGDRAIADLDAELSRRPNAYLAVLRDWLRSEGQAPGDSERVIRAALDLRPNAWKLRLALAHQALLRGDDAAARRELAAIDPVQLDLKRAAIVLGDRAMLGDFGAVEAELPSLRRRDLLTANVVASALELSRGQCAPIVEELGQLARVAHAAHRPDLAEKALRIEVLCRGELKQWPLLLASARPQLRHALAADDEAGSVSIAILAAIAAVRGGDPDEGGRLLAQVDHAGLDRGLRLDVAFARRMLGLADDDLPELADDATVQRIDPALAALMRAYVAHGRGDFDVARRELADARRDGIGESLFVWQANWLDGALGHPVNADPARLPMLWYPPTSRWAARW